MANTGEDFVRAAQRNAEFAKQPGHDADALATLDMFRAEEIGRIVCDPPLTEAQRDQAAAYAMQGMAAVIARRVTGS